MNESHHHTKKWGLSNKMRRRDYNVRHRGHDNDMNSLQHRRNKVERRSGFADFD